VSAINYGIKKNGGLPSIKYVYREGNPPSPRKKTKKEKEVRRKKQHRLVQL
jgi:hypothetical protein